MSVVLRTAVPIFRSGNCWRVAPVLVQVRWKKEPRRKPSWLPTAPSKVFRIPVHPYVPPDEKKLLLELVDEYIRKMDSIRKLFQEEEAKKAAVSAMSLKMAKLEEAEHVRCMEINQIENEKTRLIREKGMEEMLQAKINMFLEQYEEKLQKDKEIRISVDKLVKRAKARYANVITHENIDQKIEEALDSEVNMNFTIDLLGTITWEGKPSRDYEEKVKNRFNTNFWLENKYSYLNEPFAQKED